MRDEVGRPGDVARSEPAAHKVRTAMFGKDLFDKGLVGFGGSGREGQGNLAKTELEQAITSTRLTVVVTLRRCAGEDLDLPVVKPKASINCRDLWFDGAVVRQQNARRATLDDRRRDRGAIDVSQRLGGENDGGVLLAKGFQPFTQLTGKPFIIERQPPFIDDEQ